MLNKLMPLALLPSLLLPGLAAKPAEARPLFWWMNNNPDVPYSDAYDYPPPDYVDPYGNPDQRFNEMQYRAYQREMARRYGRHWQQADYPPDAPYADPPPPPYHAPVYHKPAVKKKVVVHKAIVKPAPAKQATIAPAPAPQPKAAPVVKPKPVTVPASQSKDNAIAAATPAPPKPKSGPITCDKGATIVTGFGFENVTTKSCDGGSLAYNAQRGGKPFEVDVNPTTGELVAVKKL